MSQVIKINAITVPEGSGDELGKRFAARAGAVDNQEGFEGFELFKPDRRPHHLAGRHPLARRGAFQAWVSSPAFSHGHPGHRPPAAARGPGVGVERALVLRGVDRLDRPGLTRRRAGDVQLRDAHVALAWVVIVSTRSPGCGRSGPTGGPRCGAGALWWFTAAAELTIFAQVILGVVLVAGQDMRGTAVPHVLRLRGPHLGRHHLQLPPASSRPSCYLLYGLGGLFLMGLALRAMLIGPAR